VDIAQEITDAVVVRQREHSELFCSKDEHLKPEVQIGLVMLSPTWAPGSGSCPEREEEAPHEDL
jgi:hypothetical protein